MVTLDAFVFSVVSSSSVSPSCLSTFSACLVFNKDAIKSHLEILHKGLALYSSKYEKFIVLGGFNVAMDNSDMSVFCDTYDLKDLLRKQHVIKILKIHPA